MRKTGIVTYFGESKGFGFITPDGGGNDIFFHVTRHASGRKPERVPKEGDAVSYDTEQAVRGPMAVNWMFESENVSAVRNPRQFVTRRAQKPQGYRAPQLGKNSD